MVIKMLNETAKRILDIAEKLTQTQGFNAFSYKDIQAELGIKTASIHYYFPTKQDLAVGMVERYIDQYQLTLNEIEVKYDTAFDKLKALGNVFVKTARNGKVCLCGMLASDILSLSVDAQKQLQKFFEINEKWIAEVLRQGIANKEIRNDIDPKSVAALYLATLEGGALIARTLKRLEYLKKIIMTGLEQILI